MHIRVLRVGMTLWLFLGIASHGFGQSDSSAVLTEQLALISRQMAAMQQAWQQMQTALDSVSQANSALQRRLAELQRRNAELLARSRRIKEEQVRRDSIEWRRAYTAVTRAVLRGDKLEGDFRHTLMRVKSDRLFTRLMDAQNPQGNELGFRFTEVVLQASNNTLAKHIPDKSTRKRWQAVVERVLANPFVSGFVASNPLTSITMTLVDAAINFTDVRLLKEVNGQPARRVKDLDMKAENVFQAEQIKAFVEALDPYIQFYDKLLKTNAAFRQNLDYLQLKYAELESEYTGLYARLLESLGIEEQEDRSLIDQVNALFEPPLDADGWPDYRAVLESEPVRQTLEHIESFPELEARVQRFRKDYYGYLITFLEQYYQILGELENDPTLKKNFDKKKVSGLLEEIRSYIEVLKEERGPDNA